MQFSIGIVGLPNVGKSTLFSALTKKSVSIAPYPFTTINPNVGIVQVPDPRLEAIFKTIRSEKITPASIEFTDIAGLIEGAHKGEGLGNQFLSNIRNCDAILETVRGFKSDESINVMGEINPEKEIGIIETELLSKDRETVENALSKLDKNNDKDSVRKTSVLHKIKTETNNGRPIREIYLNAEELKEIQEYQFLTQKPIFYVLNTDNDIKTSILLPNCLAINIKAEKDFAEKSYDTDFESRLDKIILSCYNILDLITFYTIAKKKETRAWAVPKNSKAAEAGRKVHSDFESRFIRAEVINWEELVKAGSWPKAKEIGIVKTVGKDYVVQDGDIIEFKI